MRTGSIGDRLARWSGCIALSLLLAPPAWANYSPPDDLSAPRGGTTTTGRRGGCLGMTESLTAIAPRSHVGQTLSPRPTFTWFVSEPEALPIEFQLYAASPTGETELVYAAELQSAPGMMTLALPETQPALQPGQRYLWQVILFCNPNSPSSAVVSEAELELGQASPELTAALAAASDPADRATLLGEAGFWYDAIAQTVSESTPAAQAAQTALLTDLAELEASGGSGDRSDRLRQIIQRGQ